MRNFKNKKLVLSICLSQVIISSLIFISFSRYNREINYRLVERDMEIVGSLKKQGLSEEQAVDIILGYRDEGEYDLGSEILGQYGYKETMDIKYQALIHENSHLFILIFSIILPLPIYGIIYFYNRKKNMELEIFNNYLDEIISGNYDLKVDMGKDEELNILKLKLNKTIGIIENNIRLLSREKVYLKDMISDISHQLKTPLSSLMIFNDLMLMDGDMEFSTRMDFIDRSKGQLERMEWLIINLLKLAKLESATVEFREEELDLDLLLRSIVRNLEEVFKQVKLSYNPCNIKVRGDSKWLEEALMNMAKNACEYSKGEVRLSLREGPIFVDIFIEDDGDGIDSDKLPFIFERFYRAEENTQSIGIGLNLAKIIIERQGGHIYVKSEKNVGTSFNIRLKRFQEN